jgi:hypothetical protein
MAHVPAFRAIGRMVPGVLVAAVVIGCGPSLTSGSPGPSGSDIAEGSPSAIATGAPGSSAPATVVPATPSPSPTPTAATEPSTRPSAAPTRSPTTTPIKTATPKPSASAGSRNTSKVLCAKLTADEVGAALVLDGLTVRPEQGDAAGGRCSYLSGDRAVATTSWLTSGASLALQGFAGQSEPVAGIGDAAVWVPSTSTLYIRKGDSLMAIQLLSSIVPPDQIKAQTIGLGKIAAGRL